MRGVLIVRGLSQRLSERLFRPIAHHISGASLRQRLLLLTMLTSAIGMALGYMVFFFYDQSAAKERKAEDLQSHADLIGTNAAAALAFDDHVEGTKLLEALRALKDIRRGILFRADDTILAVYVRADLPHPVGPP